MLQDVIAQAQLAQVSASSKQRIQLRAEFRGEGAVLITVLLQLRGDGAEPLFGRAIGGVLVDGVLLDRQAGSLEVGDGLAIGGALLFQLRGLGDAVAAVPPFVAGPQPEDERDQRERERGAGADHFSAGVKST